MNKTFCISCNGSQAKRYCPALGGQICGSCCGSKRNSVISCTADCPINPFGVNNYEEWLRLDGAWGNKCVKYVAEHYPYNEYLFKSELSKYVLIEGSQDEHVVSEATPLFVHAKLFWEPFRDENCLADYWEHDGWKGLNNDEQTMMVFKRMTYPAIIEIQNKVNDFSSWCIDMLDQEREPFIVFDRSLVANHDRFSRSVNLVCRFPHYYRVGPTGFTLQHELTEPFVEKMKIVSAQQGVSVREYMQKHFVEACRLVYEMGRRHLDSMIDSLDINEWKAIYKLNISRDEAAKVLSMKPEFLPEESETEDVMEYSWLRKGESKKLEKKMPVLFRHGDEDSGVGILGRLRLLCDTLEVIAFGAQKFGFAKKMIEKYLGACITFRMETENNLKDDLRNRMSERNQQGAETTIEETAEKENEIPPEIKAEVLNNFYEQHYRQFIDSPLPALENKTPRQATGNKRLRPKLIDIMKLHLHGIEERNREDPSLNLNIDWVIDELGLEELKRR
ncbi:MAG TPA: hypothetical protein DCO75_02710 [Fibrobacteres bacterium]|nr:hypothetical protein [Fibrobacterota bacterium]